MLAPTGAPTFGFGPERGRLCRVDLVGDAVGLDSSRGLLPRVALNRPVVAGAFAEDTREVLAGIADRAVGFALDRVLERLLGFA